MRRSRQFHEAKRMRYRRAQTFRPFALPELWIPGAAWELPHLEVEPRGLAACRAASGAASLQPTGIEGKHYTVALGGDRGVRIASGHVNGKPPRRRFMESKFSNPAPLGLAGFAFTTWMLSMVNAGWYSVDALRLVLAVAFAFGGTAQMIAGVLEYPRGNTLGTVAFLGYGSFWWSFALFAAFLGANVPQSFVGWYLLVWGVFTFYLWFASMHTSTSVQLVFLVLWITYLLLAIGAWTGSVIATQIGGYTGLITAVLAFYASAAMIINECLGHTVLPTHDWAQHHPRAA
jgi:succinate-acetate transporter protein